LKTLSLKLGLREGETRVRGGGREKRRGGKGDRRGGEKGEERGDRRKKVEEEGIKKKGRGKGGG